MSVGGPTERGRCRNNGAYEGISVMLTDSGTATPDLWSTRQRSGDRQSCTLSFQFEGGSVNPHGLPTAGMVPPTSRRLQLPVANTIFQNGNNSTLLAQQWTSTDASVKEPAMLQTKQARLPYQTVYIEEFFNPPSGATISQTLELPLTAITLPRTVATSVGNIIKTINVTNGSNEEFSIPASTELEKAVSHWMGSQDRSEQRADIWALVTPPTSQVNDTPVGELNLQVALESGSRLHRVISGGGGWGGRSFRSSFYLFQNIS